MSKKTERDKPLVIECERLVKRYFNNKTKAFHWWQIPNPILHGYSPLDMVKMGKANELLFKLKHALEIKHADRTKSSG